jgi:asparagine synthetase B (glutamine-hydrolysing)
MYMTSQRGVLYFSEDLRELLPFTERRINPVGAFSVLKYGEVPERITVIDGIYTIPVGNFLTITEENLASAIGQKNWVSQHFQPFFKLDFPMDGGNLEKTETLLNNQFEFISKLNPLVPISGGVDSTLINCLINRFTDNPYPAYFMQFGNDDPELSFAIEAAKATKADLYVGTLQPSDMVRSFGFQSTQLYEPIGESSTISLAFYFSQHLKSGHTIIDGTLADGCYGSTNYNRGVIGEIPKRAQWQQKLNEKIAAFVQFNDLPGKDRFFPRDSLMNDPYLQFMDVYLGPFANTWVKNAASYCNELLPLWQDYYKFLQISESEQDDWKKYSVFKMVNYACKNNTAKTFDNSKPDNLGLYPFTWRSVLLDQGHYSWAEKSKDNIIKYPLKRILEQYMRHNFIHRKKVGLNACFEDWIHTPENRAYLIELLNRENGIAEFFFGTSRRNALVKKFRTSILHPNLARMVINITLMQGWMDYNRVTV